MKEKNEDKKTSKCKSCPSNIVRLIVSNSKMDKENKKDI